MNADTLKPITFDPHSVNQLLIMDKKIDIPGCVGVVPVFINGDAARKWAGDDWSIQRCRIKQ